MPTKKAAAPAKIVDVAHPDSVKADPTSIPIIVKHGPMLKDPMVAPEKPAEKPDEKKEEDSPVVTKIELKPVSADEDKADKPKESAKEEAKPEPEKLTGDVKPVEPTAEENPEEAAKEKEAKPTAEAEKSAEPAATDDGKEEKPAEGQELLPGAEPTDPAAAKAAREAAEKQLALDKIAADGTYFLPINAVEKRKVRTFLVVFLVVIVLGAVGFLAALDAGYVHVDGFKAPTDFIKNN